MCRRVKNTIEEIITGYRQRMAPSDYEDIGIDTSTLAKAANPSNRRQLSFKDARKLEEYRHSLTQPLLLTEWFTDGLDQNNVCKANLPDLIKHITLSKKEAEDVSTAALNLLSDGHASQSDLKSLLNEVEESYLAHRRLKHTIETMIEGNTKT